MAGIYLPFGLKLEALFAKLRPLGTRLQYELELGTGLDFWRRKPYEAQYKFHMSGYICITCPSPDALKDPLDGLHDALKSCILELDAQSIMNRERWLHRDELEDMEEEVWETPGTGWEPQAQSWTGASTRSNVVLANTVRRKRRRRTPYTLASLY